MQSARFDRLIRRVAATASRRGVLGAALLAALGGARTVEDTAAAVCRSANRRCRSADQCCDGICKRDKRKKGKKRKKPKRRCQRRVCKPGQTIENCGGTGLRCTSSTGNQGQCNSTTSNEAYCASGYWCAPCLRDEDCVPYCGPQAACFDCTLYCGVGVKACGGPGACAEP